MKTLDIAAILGAAAWTPYLISLFRSWFLKPEVQIVTAPKPEVGFTTFGPIFNLRIAFVVKYSDLVLTGVKIKLKHEDGETIQFEWRSILQSLGHLVPPEAGSIPMEKESSVLAIMLKQKEIDERLIRFQESRFVKRLSEYEDKAVKKVIFLREQDKENSINVTTVEEIVDMCSFVKRSFCWKSGKYEVEFILNSSTKFRLKGNKYEFSLLSTDIEELERNKNHIEQSYDYMLNPPEDNEHIPWNWRNPTLKEVV